MMVCLVLLLLSTPVASSFLLGSSGLSPRPISTRRATVVLLAPGLVEASDRQCPEEFWGPWEMTSSLSGAESFWVELEPEGGLKCSSKIGRGKEWNAEQDGRRWTLRMTYLDKLSRPLTLMGTIADDEYQEQAIAGAVLGPPKRTQARQSQQEQAIAAANSLGVKLGEFRGFKLN
jgi:hypothetical protein